MKTYSNSKNNPSTEKHFKLASTLMILTAVGLLFARTVMADPANLQVASINKLQNSEPTKEMIMRKMIEEDESEIGSVLILETDTGLGAFSSEDGAMMGAYGDGEYID